MKLYVWVVLRIDTNEKDVDDVEGVFGSFKKAEDYVKSMPEDNSYYVFEEEIL
jgi:hypothetical protein